MSAAAQKKQLIENTQPSQTQMALHLLSVTNDLTAVLSEESGALTQGKSKTIEVLTQRKRDLFSFYAAAMGDIQALGQPKMDIDDALRASVRDATFQFKAALERNQRLLKSQLDISQGLMQTIGEEVQREQSPVRTYSSPGDNKRPHAPTSLALNRTI